MNFGEKVKQLRAERNLTQPQLAQAIGIEQSYLSKLENDKSVPSADIFQAILRAFSIDVATLLDGVDDRVVRRELRQIPEVSNLVTSRVNLRVHSIKRWLFASAIACALGLTLALAGHRGLLFSDAQFTYESEGILHPGDPTNLFELQGDLRIRHASGVITNEELAERLEDISGRTNQQMQLLNEYRGKAFMEEVEGGQRLYRLVDESKYERAENRWLMFLGALLTFSGLLGFVVEQRLRSVKL